jgi:hypothetical protein
MGRALVGLCARIKGDFLANPVIRLLLTITSSVLGVMLFFAPLLATNHLGLRINFPAPGGESDFAFRASLFFFGVFPALFFLGGLIGFTSGNLRTFALKWVGAVVASMIVFLAVFALRSKIESLTANGAANSAVAIVFLAWVVTSFLGAYLGSVSAQKSSKSL